MKQKSVLKTSLELLRHQFLHIAVVMTLVKVISITLLKFVSSKVFQIMLLEANIQGLNNDNFMNVLKSPTAIIFLLLWISVICIFMIGEIMFLLIYFNRSYSQQKISFKIILNKMKRLIKPSFIFFALYVLVLMPNMNLGISAGFAAHIKLPKFIIDFFFERLWLTVVYFIVLGILFVSNILLFYAPTIFVFEDLSFFESCKRSIRLSRKRFVSICRLLFQIGLITFLINLIVSSGVHALTAWMRVLLPNSVYLVEAMSSSVLFILVMFVLAFSQVFIYQVVVVSYHREMNNEHPIEAMAPKRKNKARGIIVALVVTFVISTIGIYVLDVNGPLPPNTLIVSHRGDSRKAVENSLEALEAAALLGADYVEMDVQMSADGDVVVIHDFNLKRLAGDSRLVIDVTFAELIAMPIRTGSYTTLIPSFEAYLKAAKDLDQKLLIELKQDKGASPEFVDRVLEIVEDLEMEEMVYYQSINKALILDLKERYPHTYAGFILGFSIGGLEQLNVDFYSLESSAVTKKVLTDLLIWNKGLFVWTVNKEQGMKNYLRMGVTGIITDQIELAIKEKEFLPDTSIADYLWEMLP